MCLISYTLVQGILQVSPPECQGTMCIIRASGCILRVLVRAEENAADLEPQLDLCLPGGGGVQVNLLQGQCLWPYRTSLA